jgi:hypothetical protein
MPFAFVHLRVSFFAAYGLVGLSNAYGACNAPGLPLTPAMINEFLQKPEIWPCCIQRRSPNRHPGHYWDFASTVAISCVRVLDWVDTSGILYPSRTATLYEHR